jgi:predicted Zn-dependent protease
VVVAVVGSLLTGNNLSAQGATSPSLAPGSSKVVMVKPSTNKPITAKPIAFKPVAPVETPQQRMQRVGKRLLQKNLVQDPIAFTLGKNLNKAPNAHAKERKREVVLEPSVFQYIANDDELAAILGHEMAHILARHTTQTWKRRLGSRLLIGVPVTVLTVALPGIGIPLALGLGAASSGASELYTRKGSREQELQSDRLAMLFLKRAGYNPAAMGTILQKMAGDQTSKPWGVFKTHPPTPERLEQVRAELKKLQ